MIILDIQFFLSCVKEIKPLYVISNDNHKRQLETFIKTWIFYNSSQKKIYWTGKSSTMVTPQDKVKEHWYGNLSSAKYCLNNMVFCEGNQIKNFLKVFAFMQWNYTTQNQNISLIPFQNYDMFYKPNEIKGDPEEAYRRAGIEFITDPHHVNLLPVIEQFLSIDITECHIFEIVLKGQYLINLTNALQHYNDIVSLKIGDKGMLVKTVSRDFTNCYKIVMTEILNTISGTVYAESFLGLVNQNTGPYRFENNFTYPNRSFSVNFNNTIIYLNTYNPNKYKYDKLIQVLDILDGNCLVYDKNLTSIYSTEEEQ